MFSRASFCGCEEQFEVKEDILLVDAVSRRGYPVLVEDGSAAPVGAGKPEEGGPPHRNLINRVGV